MPSTLQEVYQNQVLPLGEKERLNLAALIINDISNKPETNGASKSAGGISEMFGSVSLGHPTGSDNEGIDADLAREYGSTHEDEILIEEQPANEESDWDRLLAAIEENQIDADITDLAHNHDHYLYGTAKREY